MKTLAVQPLLYTQRLLMPAIHLPRFLSSLPTRRSQMRSLQAILSSNVQEVIPCNRVRQTKNLTLGV